MSEFIWSKSDHGSRGPDEAVQDFLAGDDVVLDRHLFLFDIEATGVHARGLARIGILENHEAEKIAATLEALAVDFRDGGYTLGPPFEDGHSAIEAHLTAELGDIGRKVHTGRSRNDQVQVALRMYMRDRLERLFGHCRAIAGAFLERAQSDADTVMPGYTHLQRAVPSTVGLWLGGLAEAFVDNAILARDTREWINSCPLGTAAGYGVNLPLDRDFVAAELGFDRLQVNPQYAQNSRGRFELQALTALAQCTLELRRFAWDLSLYASEEFGFVRLPSRYVTGSSIMPNKANPDTVELLRAQHAVVQGAISELQGALSLPSGYHRDLQVTKAPLIRAFEAGLRGLGLLPELIGELDLDREAMRAAIDVDMYATDVAVEAARAGVPFREAYRRALSDGDTAERTPEKSTAERGSPGGCADLRLDHLRRRLASL